MSEQKEQKIPKVGMHVRMEWLDSAEAPGWSYGNEEPKLYPRSIISLGTVVGRTPLGIVLCAHVSEPNSGDGERGYLSLLSVPYGAILEWKALK